MLQVARVSPKLLGDSSDLVHGFISSQLQPDGGFADRAGRSDLYYTVFGLECLIALRREVPGEVIPYLEGFGDGEGLDFVHLACLARCWANVARVPESILRRIESFRRADGGYGAGTAYAAFLALGAYEDGNASPPDVGGLLGALRSLRAADGAYGLTTTTAAAVLIERHLCGGADAGLGDWLLARVHPQGGFRAGPDAPIPDLLSTATALHALSALHARIEPIREDCLDFIDTLWTNRGGFHGSWADDAIDCEYTYYGLLALGHLAL